MSMFCCLFVFCSETTKKTTQKMADGNGTIIPGACASRASHNSPICDSTKYTNDTSFVSFCDALNAVHLNVIPIGMMVLVGFFIFFALSFCLISCFMRCAKNINISHYTIMIWIFLWYSIFVSETFTIKVSDNGNEVLCIYKLFCQYFAGTLVSCYTLIMTVNAVRVIRNPFEKAWSWGITILYHGYCWVIALTLFVVGCIFREVSDAGCRLCAPSFQIRLTSNIVLLVQLVADVLCVAYICCGIYKGFPGTQRIRVRFYLRLLVFSIWFLLVWGTVFAHRVLFDNIRLDTRIESFVANSRAIEIDDVKGFVILKLFRYALRSFGAFEIGAFFIIFVFDEMVTKFVKAVFRKYICCCCCKKKPFNEDMKQRLVETDASFTADGSFYYDVRQQQLNTLQTTPKYSSIDYILRRDVLACIMTGITNSAIDVKKVSNMEGHHFSFVKKNNKVYSPLTQHTFAMKEYAPNVFHNIRNKCNVPDHEFIESFKPDLVVREFILEKFSEGKSGSFFCITSDSKYIIKTITSKELAVLREVLPSMYHYYANNPNTLLCKFFGCFELNMNFGFTIRFVVLNNIFDNPEKTIHERFDLKGSWINRHGKQGGLKLDSDLQEFLVLTDDSYEAFVRQVMSDAKFLASVGIMDYSLLVGVHERSGEVYAERKKKEEKNSLRFISQSEMESVLETAPIQAPRKPGQSDAEQDQIDTNMPPHRREYLGMKNHDGTKIYYMGIIDVLQQYDMTKKVEHFLKTSCQRKNPKGISAVNPVYYAERFQKRVLQHFTTISILSK